MFSLILSSCGSSSNSSSSGINTWTFVSGSNITNQNGTYGSTVGIPGGMPGSRYATVSWFDGSNMWLFGGYGYDLNTNEWGYLNDFWKFDGANWTWVSGSDIIDQKGIYSTPGSNVPGARYGAVSWFDNSNPLDLKLWLFGGVGYASTGTSGNLNDLWKFDVSNSTWTLVSGSSTTNQKGIYSTPGSNVPGARYGAVSWFDGTNMWLFGGYGYDSTGSYGYLNDLWKFDGANWTWVSGSSTTNQKGIYSTPGSNVPGARYGAVSWFDGTNMWLFGGVGYDSTPTTVGYLNDLWKFDGANWTWVSGSNLAGQVGTYGTKGVPGHNNVPGARSGAVSWFDGTNMWLFGGNYSLNTIYSFNDLWKFDGANWTWVSGSNAVAQYGIYGGTAVPGSRYGAVSWFDDSSGYLWLFGGVGYDSRTGTGITGNPPDPGYLNDRWYYQL
jgi:hypothetical protein